MDAAGLGTAFSERPPDLIGLDVEHRQFFKASRCTAGVVSHQVK